jgi:hypothetical protein
VTGLCLWRLLPEGHGAAAFRFDRLRSVHRFAAGMVGIGILATPLTQADKIVLSKVLSLENFGTTRSRIPSARASIASLCR